MSTSMSFDLLSMTHNETCEIPITKNIICKLCFYLKKHLEDVFFKLYVPMIGLPADNLYCPEFAVFSFFIP